MKKGDLVRMKEDDFKIMGIIVHVFMDDFNDHEIYKVEWFDELCDPSFTTKENLEAVCKVIQ
jgi:hypothetical protein